MPLKIALIRVFTDERTAIPVAMGELQIGVDRSSESAEDIV